MILIVSVLGMAIPGVVIVLLLRTLQIARASQSASYEAEDLAWRNYPPFQRMLDQSDFDFLRRGGIGEKRIQTLRAERRTIYRLGLRNLAQDFNYLHSSLTVRLVHAHEDRPDLVAELAKQRVAFYRNVLLAEFRLALHWSGVGSVPAIDLLKPLEVLHSQMQMLAPATN